MAKSEQEKIKKKLLELVLSINNEHNTCLFINHFQVRLINLSNLLYGHVNEGSDFLSFSEAKTEISEFTKISVLQILDDLLSHSQVHFSQFINPAFIIPNKLRDIANKQFECVLSDFNSLSGCLPNKFIEIITEPLQKFITNPEIATNQHLNYLKRFSTDLLMVIEQNDETQLFSHLKTKLFYLNFNSVGYFNFLTEEMNEALSKIDSHAHKIEKLSWFLKEINQMPVKPEFAYNQGQKSIQGLASHWIVEELCHLEKSIHCASISAQNVNNSISADSKVSTALSVPQLAYFIKILVETGVVNSPNDRDLIKFIATNTSSKKAATISPESLRIKYYSVEENTKDEIKDIVIKLLNHINKSKSLTILLYFLLSYSCQVSDIILLASCD